MRRMARVDGNQSEIVDGLRRIGAEVQHLHTIGKGCPDLLVAFRGQWYAVEVKDGEKPAAAQKLTPDEVAWHEKFSRHAPVYVWTSLDDAMKQLGIV